MKQHQLHEQLITHIENTGNVMAQFDMKLHSLESASQQTQNAMNIMKMNQLLPLQQQVEEQEKTLSAIQTSELPKLYLLTDQFYDLKTSTVSIQNDLFIIKDKIQSIPKQMEEMTLPMSYLAKSLDEHVISLTNKMNTIDQSLSQYKQQSNEAIHILRESLKKVKSKQKLQETNQITAQEQLKQFKENLEILLIELQDQINEEMKQQYHNQSSIQRLEEQYKQIIEEEIKLLQEQLINWQEYHKKNMLENIQEQLQPFQQGNVNV